jgi:predicted RNase H-like HicB family nuclease
MKKQKKLKKKSPPFDVLTIRYEDFVCRAVWDEKAGQFWGRLKIDTGHLNYQGKTIEEVVENCKSCVDDYISVKKQPGLIRFSPTERLRNKHFILVAIEECLNKDDYEGIEEVLNAHKEAMQSTKNSPDDETLQQVMKDNPTDKGWRKAVLKSKLD